jgi:Cft2 family RNA processing exonuclease
VEIITGEARHKWISQELVSRCAGTVIKSKFHVSYNGTEILLDCGLFHGLKELWLRNWSPLPVRVKELRAVIPTHAHIDHSGYLPKLVKLGFRGDVYATSATCDLLRILLPDSAYLQGKKPAMPRSVMQILPAISR